MLRYESRLGGGPMQTSSSANLTCSASTSAVECTATVLIPSSLQARMTRRAISPRLAIRILRNMERPPAPLRRHRPQPEQDLAEFHGLAVGYQNLHDLGVYFGFDLVHEFHRLDDA